MPVPPQPAPLHRDPPPVLGAIFLGGESRRMGRPKHLLEWNGETWLARIERVLSAVVPEIVLVGDGDLPHTFSDRKRIRDARGGRGPVAGLVALLEHREETAWLALACDQPLVSEEVLRWLLGARDGASAAVLPSLTRGRIEPFPGIYEPASLPGLLELARAEGSERSLQRLPGLIRVASPDVPPGLAGALRGANTAEEARQIGRID